MSNMCLGNTNWSSKTLNINTSSDLGNYQTTNVITPSNVNTYQVHKLDNALNVLHLNVRSLKAKIDCIKDLIINCEKQD